MSKIIDNYNAAIIDCVVLEEEFDRFMVEHNLESAQECTEELTKLIETMVHKILGLRGVLIERGYTDGLNMLGYYLSRFEELNNGAKVRTALLLVALGIK